MSPSVKVLAKIEHKEDEAIEKAENDLENVVLGFEAVKMILDKESGMIAVADDQDPEYLQKAKWS